MYYLLLIICLLCLTIFSYIYFKKDIIDPSFIVCLTYFVSTLTAYISYLLNMWNFVNIKFNTFLIVIIGVLSFVTSEVIIKKIFSKHSKISTKINNNENYKIIKIAPIKIAFIIIFLILTFIIIFIQVRNITGEKSIAAMINKYRYLTPLFNNTDSVTSIDTFAAQIYRISEMVSLIFLYIIVNNIILKDKLKNNIPYIFGIMIFLMISLLISGRSTMIQLFIESIFMFYILYIKIFDKPFPINKIKKIILIFLIIILPSFYAIMPIIGRKQNTSFINYMTFYVGSPVPALDEIITRNEVGKSIYFGEETFTGIENVLNRLGIINYYSPFQKQWINFRGLPNNIFTGLKPYYSDFGLPGVIILQSLFSIITTLFYLKIRNNNNKILFLAYIFFFSYSIVDSFRLEKLFATIISMYTIIYLIYLFIVYWFIFGLQINENKEVIKNEKGIFSCIRKFK
jgi:oligosaccharide repeat unit polymerase